MQKLPKGPIIFLRHGETDWNVKGLYQGHRNTALTKRGREQAENCAAEIQRIVFSRNLEPLNFEIISSPLARARETAEIISDRLGGDRSAITTAEELTELSMGRWEGLNSQQVKDQFYTERQSRKTNRWHFKPVGGESLSEREQMVTNWITSIPANSIVVTHSGILRVIHHVLTASDRDESSVLSIGHAKIWVWVCDKLHTSSCEIAQN